QHRRALAREIALHLEQLTLTPDEGGRGAAMVGGEGSAREKGHRHSVPACRRSEQRLLARGQLPRDRQPADGVAGGGASAQSTLQIANAARADSRPLGEPALWPVAYLCCCCCACSFSCRRRILPEGVLGIASTSSRWRIAL